MAAGSNEGSCGGGDRIHNPCDVSGETPKSPWKTSAAASPVAGTDSESWPALSDAQQRPKNNVSVDSQSVKSPPLPSQAENHACGAHPAAPAPVGVIASLICSESVVVVNSLLAV